MSLGESDDVVESPLRLQRLHNYSSSLERGIAVLWCFTPEQQILGVAEIADQLGIASRTTIHRYILTLRELGLLEQVPGRKYRLGPRAGDIGLAALSQRGLQEHSHQPLLDLARDVGLPAGLIVLDGLEVVLVDWVRSPMPRPHQTQINFSMNVGARRAAHATASGKLLLAYQPKSYVQSQLEGVALQRVTSKTITAKEKLYSELVLVRKQGHATADNEWAEGIGSIAIPVRDFAGEVVAAVELMTASIALANIVKHYAPHLHVTAEAISERLHFRSDQQDE